MRRIDHTSSGRPAASTAKDIANTDQFKDAPQYIQNAACAPGYPPDSHIAVIRAHPKTLATRDNNPAISDIPIKNSP
jgi:hypothetical protein